MSGRRGRSLDGEEQALWSTFTRTIAPLEKKRRPASAKRLDDMAGEPDPPVRSGAIAKTPSAPAKIQPSPPPASLTGFDRKTKKRVAKGRDAIDARLDLHGKTQAQAHGALTRFLHRAVEQDARLVLVITGKGRGEGTGVLRQQLPHWLHHPDLRGLVVGFEGAHAAHGGEGAFYIRLRRSRVRE